MARNHSTETTACAWWNTWAQTTARTPGIGTGTATVPVGLSRGWTISRDGGHTVEHFLGGEYAVQPGIIKRVLTLPTACKDWTLAGKCLRGTSVQTPLPFLTFALATDVGFSRAFTDCWIKSAKFSLGGRPEFLSADYEVWALREAAYSYSAQTASTGYGPALGSQLTTATIEGTGNNRILSWECTVDNGFDWHITSDPQASGDEIECDDFEEGPEAVTLNVTTAKPIADATFNLGEKTLVQDIDVVFTFTVGAHTITFTFDEMFGTADTIQQPGRGKTTYQYSLRGAKPQGSLAITTT